MKKFIYNWREYGFKLAWSMLTNPKAWEPVECYPTWEQVSALELSATLAERERIIKLLEEARDRCGCYEVGMLICRHTPTVDETIALIKGEN